MRGLMPYSERPDYPYCADKEIEGLDKPHNLLRSPALKDQSPGGGGGGGTQPVCQQSLGSQPHPPPASPAYRVGRLLGKTAASCPLFLPYQRQEGR